MLIFVAALAVACAVRALRPHGPRACLKLRFVGMPVLAAVLQLALGTPFLSHLGAIGRLSIVLVSYTLVGAWLIGNTINQSARLRWGGVLLAAGWLANALAIVTNRGMPVSRSALAVLGVHHPSVANGNLFKHVLETPQTHLAWLGDVVPVAIPVLRNVISIGDVLMCVGVILLIQRIELAPGTFSKKAARESHTDVVLQVPNSS